MGSLIARLIINAVALWVAAQVVPGIQFGVTGRESIVPILIVALIFGVVNALIKPILKLVTCPFYLLTLGLFTFIVNAAMLWLTSAVSQSLGQPFVVQGFVAALLGSIVISIISFLLNIFVSDDGND